MNRQCDGERVATVPLPTSGERIVGLRVSQVRVSRAQARLSLVPDGIQLQHCGSRRGTRPSDQLLASGDVIGIRGAC